MEEFFKSSGAYSYVVVAIISFFLGTLSPLIVDYFKRKVEKDRLIDLFVDHINTNWSKLDELTVAPIEPYFSRAMGYFKGVKTQPPFSSQPEYEVEVDNLKFFETEGFKLIQHLGKQARKEFWEVYSLIRDAEAIREVIKLLPKDHKDRPSYQNLFVEIMKKVSPMFTQLAETLKGERNWYRRLL